MDRSGAETAKSRSHVYHLLSMLYLKEITTETLSFLTGRDVKAVLNDLGMDIDRILPDTAHKKLLNDLSEEYAALFIVPGGIPPYESVRLQGLLNQKSTFEVEEFYRMCGLAVRGNAVSCQTTSGWSLSLWAFWRIKNLMHGLTGTKKRP
jgi:TorA maturation chaperone TorD